MKCSQSKEEILFKTLKKEKKPDYRPWTTFVFCCILQKKYIYIYIIYVLRSSKSSSLKKILMETESDLDSLILAVRFPQIYQLSYPWKIDRPRVGFLRNFRKKVFEFYFAKKSFRILLCENCWIPHSAKSQLRGIDKLYNIHNAYGPCKFYDFMVFW